MYAEVVDAMLPFLQNPTGNPSSLHSYGRMARSAVESARAEVANLVGCSSDAVIFTSGGTEANNLFLKGFVDKSSELPVVSTEIEHPSILEPLKQLQADGQTVILLKPDTDGLIDLEAAAPILAGILRNYCRLFLPITKPVSFSHLKSWRRWLITHPAWCTAMLPRLSVKFRSIYRRPISMPLAFRRTNWVDRRAWARSWSIENLQMC